MRPPVEERLLQGASKKSLSFEREQLLYKIPNKEETGKTRCIMTFNKNSGQVGAILKKYWFLLTQDSVLSQNVSNHPSIIYRKHNSLRDLLVSSHFSEAITKIVQMFLNYTMWHFCLLSLFGYPNHGYPTRRNPMESTTLSFL